MLGNGLGDTFMATVIKLSAAVLVFEVLGARVPTSAADLEGSYSMSLECNSNETLELKSGNACTHTHNARSYDGLWSYDGQSSIKFEPFDVWIPPGFRTDHNTNYPSGGFETYVLLGRNGVRITIDEDTACYFIKT